MFVQLELRNSKNILMLGPLIYIIYVNDVLKLLSDDYNIFLYMLAIRL